ncbi:Lactoylglutathione lyase-related lyase [Archaeoglobus sulfaticallidus PM70-1]|uniref:Lactoylglutathione lyase-related lyase n=1 Tax=Archaeoglobus sulfaticallidus PM70-1 TaxID=387631 RepID=N0B9U8_9EURY|nr:VOC family protein [Archaeoglobus sulfaticallidus]AGK60369.1 Lactoylglutathione lyase-related lyase [Archaeoglobus sulfaticallidus PM70-1]
MGREVEKIDHVVVAVKDAEKAMRFFSELLGIEFDEIGEERNWKFKSYMSPEGLELLVPTSEDSETAKFIEKRGEGLFALSFKVSDAEKIAKKAEEMGIRIIGKIEREGFKEIFLHPKDCFGIQILLTEYKDYHGCTVALAMERKEDKYI